MHFFASISVLRADGVIIIIRNQHILFLQNLFSDLQICVFNASADMLTVCGCVFFPNGQCSLFLLQKLVHNN